MRRRLWVVGFLLLAAVGVGVWLGMRGAKPPEQPAVPVEQWLARLRSEDTEEGTRAWHELAALGGEGVPALLAALEGDDIRARRRAAMGLVQVGGPAVPGLVAMLPGGAQRVDFVLARIGEPAIPDLMAALRDPKKARAAAHILGNMGERARGAVPALAALLADAKADEDDRIVAAEALGLIGAANPTAPKPDDPVIAALQGVNGPKDVRVEVVWALQRCGAADALRRLADDESIDVAKAACAALGDVGGPVATTVLPKKLDDKDCRDRAAEGLGQLGPLARPAVSRLVSLAKESGAAREALVELRALAVPDLRSALKDKDAGQRIAAAKVLRELGPFAPEAALELTVMLGSGDPDEVIAAARAARPIRSEGMTRQLIESLYDQSEGVRGEAPWALGAKGRPLGEDVRQSLVGALADPSRMVRLAAVKSLHERGELTPEPGVAATVAGLMRSSWHGGEEEQLLSSLLAKLDAAAVRSHRAGPRQDSVLELLRQLDIEGWHRDAATDLGKMGPAAKEALPALRRRARRDSDERVRRACEAAIKAIEAK